MFLSCISAYFCGFTHLVLSTYLPRKQVYLSQLASKRIWPRPKFLKGPFHLFRNWITKRREDRPSTKKKRTTKRYFYPNPIFRAISSFPRAMDEKNNFQTREQQSKCQGGSRVYNLAEPPWGKKERNAISVNEEPTNVIFSIGCNRNLE